MYEEESKKKKAGLQPEVVSVWYPDVLSHSAGLYMLFFLELCRVFL